MIALRSAAKLNLTLDLLGKRADGYHEIRSVVQTISVWDEIALAPTAWPASFVCNRPDLQTDDNLCLRAARLLAAEADRPCQVHIELQKRIPVGAGLGGGSGNAAAVLSGLNELWSLNRPPETLRRLAARLGADAPYFLHGGLALMEGVGERVTPLSPPLPPCWFVVLQGPRPMATAEAYRRFDERPRWGTVAHDRILELLRRGRFYDAAPLLRNALEPAVVDALPEVVRLKELLHRCGALGAAMTGSGAAVFGVFPSRPEAERAQRIAAKSADASLALLAEPTSAGVVRASTNQRKDDSPS